MSSVLTIFLSLLLNYLPYTILFSEGEECSWIDRVEERFQWLKKALVDFEERLGTIHILRKHLYSTKLNLTT